MDSTTVSGWTPLMRVGERVSNLFNSRRVPKLNHCHPVPNHMPDLKLQYCIVRVEQHMS